MGTMDADPLPLPGAPRPDARTVHVAGEGWHCAPRGHPQEGAPQGLGGSPLPVAEPGPLQGALAGDTRAGEPQ